jgi:hypothetical protein
MSSIENYQHDTRINAIPFEDIRASTQTFTVKSNIQIMDLEQFFEKIELLKTDEGEILNVKYKNSKKGLFEEQVKKRISRKKADDNKQRRLKRNFLNCVSLVIMTEKKINIKVFKNGVFQITGCRKETDVTKCINLIFDQLKRNLDIFEFREGETDFIILIKSAMRNVDFNVNYKIDRSILSQYLRSFSEYNIPPLSSTNMGIKMKIPFNIKDLPITKIVYNRGSQTSHKLFLRDCIDEIEPNKTRQKAKFENKFNNATIFQNGKVLMSCVDESFQRNYYYWIADLLIRNKDVFQIPEHSKKTFRF